MCREQNCPAGPSSFPTQTWTVVPDPFPSTQSREGGAEQRPGGTQAWRGRALQEDPGSSIKQAPLSPLRAYRKGGVAGHCRLCGKRFSPSAQETETPAPGGEESACRERTLSTGVLHNSEPQPGPGSLPLSSALK